MHIDVVGLIPAAGHANRLAPLPFSKELYPIRLTQMEAGAERPKVACQYLLDKMRRADITKAYIVIREGKWDIPAYLLGGSAVNIDLGYLVVTPTAGPPYTLDAAYPFVRDAVVAFGFPDILFDGEDAFRQLLSHQALNEADIVLGLVPADRPEEMDMVEVDKEGRVTELLIKPRQTQLRYSWDVAVWTPVFTKFLHEYVTAHRATAALQPELSVGGVIQVAIRQKLAVKGIQVSAEPYLDIGTSQGLAKALKRYGR
jgi:glucose-1-phosphate thymidylyltransferase